MSATLTGLSRVVGAVYIPSSDIVPIFGEVVHFTPLAVVPVTVAVNCRDAPGLTVTLEGVTVTATVGISERIAVANVVELLILIALISTV